MADYLFEDTLQAEQYNTLLLLDKQLQGIKEDYTVELHVLGGTALLFHDICSVVTIDIDCANKLEEDVKVVLEPFVSDAAHEVATLAKNYTDRLVPYKPDDFKVLVIKLLSLEDLVITKLGAGRFKDMEDLTKTNLLDVCDLRKCMDIITAEFDSSTASKLLGKLTNIV